MSLNQYEEGSSPQFSNKKSRDMKHKIMNQILENSLKKQPWQPKNNNRSRVVSVDQTAKKVSQFNDSVQKSNSKDLIYSLQEELRGLNEQISIIQKQYQTNELIQLEKKSVIDKSKLDIQNKENFISELIKNPSEFSQLKQINLQRYKQLLGDTKLKDLLLVERNDIIKEIQDIMDKDYEYGIKKMQNQIQELQNKKISAQETYELQKQEIDNLSERKSMLKEDLNGKLMQRAELVAQREYLDEILEEFRQKYKLEIDYIEDENQIQSILNNKNQALQQLNSLKKQKQNVAQTVLSQIYQKNDELFDSYQVLCNSYLTKYEQISTYNSTTKNIEQGLNNLLNKYLILAFNYASEQKANRQIVNNLQSNDDQFQNWAGFSHLNFTDKKKVKDEFYKLKKVHNLRLNGFLQWCDYIQNSEHSQRPLASHNKNKSIPSQQQLTDDNFAQILQQFCDNKQVPNFDQEKIISVIVQYKKILLEQNQLLEDDRKMEEEQMKLVESQEREISQLQEKKRQIEKEQFILDEEYQQLMISIKQNQQHIQQKKGMLDHNLHLQSDQAFSEYLINEKQIFTTLEKSYGIKAAAQIKKEHHKQFVEKIKETQNKRIQQLKKIILDLNNLNKSIEFNLYYVENILFIELNNIESSLLTFKKSIQIKQNELNLILEQEKEFQNKLNVISEARKIYFDNLSKIETLNTSQIMITNCSDQNNNNNQSIDNNNHSQVIQNKVHYPTSKIQNYFPTERALYKNNINENLDKPHQYNTIDQIGIKESIDSDSYRIQDRNYLLSGGSAIDIKRNQSKSMFNTIDCIENDEQSQQQQNYDVSQKQYYYNTKETKHFGQCVSKSMDNSRRNSICPINQTTYRSKRQSLNAIVSQPSYLKSQNNNNNNNNNNNLTITSNVNPVHKSTNSFNFSTSISNYMPFSKQQQQSFQQQTEFQQYQSSQQQQQEYQPYLQSQNFSQYQPTQEYQQQPQQQNINHYNNNNNTYNNIIKDNILQPRQSNFPSNTVTNREKDGQLQNGLKEQLNKYQYKIVKFNLNNMQLKHIQILETIKPLLEGRKIFKKIGGGQNNINNNIQFNPFSLENTSPEQCGYIVRMAHLNRHLTKIEFRSYQFSIKGQKQIQNSLDSAISVDHMLRVVIPPTTLDLVKFQKHFDVIKSQNNSNNNQNIIKTNEQDISTINQLHNTTLNTYTTKQNDSSFVNNTNISFSNNLSNNYSTLNNNNNNNVNKGSNNTNGNMNNYSNLSIIHDQNVKMDKILNGKMYPFQIIMDKGNRLDLVAETYENYRIWVNLINTLIKYRKALNSLKSKIEFIVL